MSKAQQKPQNFDKKRVLSPQLLEKVSGGFVGGNGHISPMIPPFFDNVRKK